MYKTKDYTLFSSAARYAATTNGTGVDVSACSDFVVTLTVSAITGGPTSLDVAIQGSYDGTNYGAFKTAIAFTQVTSSTGTENLRISNFGGKYIRAVATIAGGTASKTFTFSVYAYGKGPD